MVRQNKRLLELFTMLLTSSASCLFPLRSGIATEPFWDTVVEQKNDKWELKDDYLGGYKILVVDKSEKTTLELWLRDALSDAEYKRYVCKTTAGPQWEDLALSYFVNYKGTTYFCVRTWWGRRILIDLAVAKQVSERGMEKVLIAAEQDAVVETLRNGVFTLSDRKSTLPSVLRLQAAIHVAGCLNAKETIPILRKLETADSETANTLAEYGPGTELKKGEISPQNYSTFGIRRLVQLSLRRMGEKPLELANTSFRLHGSDKAFEPRKWAKPRAQRADVVKAGMTPIEVLNAIGAPDYVEFGQDIKRQGPWEAAWRYEMDAESTYTLLVIWDGHKVKAKEKIRPALWKGNELSRPGSIPAIFGPDGSLRNAGALYTDAYSGTITVLK